MTQKQEILELQSRITQLEIENTRLKHDSEVFATIRNTLSKTMLGSVDTLKIKNGSRVSTKINFRENDSYVACLETTHEYLKCFFKTQSELKRACMRVGLMNILIEFGKEAEKSDIHYGLPKVEMLANIKKVLSIMLKLANIEHDNIIKRTEKEFDERKSYAMSCMGNVIDKSKLDALDESKADIINVYTPDFSVNVTELVGVS